MDIIKLILSPLITFCLGLLSIFYQKRKNHDFSDLTGNEKYQFIVNWLELKKKCPVINNASYAIYDTFYYAHGFKYGVEFNESIISFVLESRISFLDKELNAFLGTSFLMRDGVQSPWARRKRRLAVVTLFPCCLFLFVMLCNWSGLFSSYVNEPVRSLWPWLWGLSVASSFVICLCFCGYFIAQVERSKKFWKKLYRYLNQGC
ncbi:hypothetical protein [Citrobacter amalonaticus]|uniref:hypothetical protein n=1 Tax=Citrobacter amalonaticus TaxID=35703 RepID=UPI00300DAA17